VAAAPQSSLRAVFSVAERRPPAAADRTIPRSLGGRTRFLFSKYGQAAPDHSMNGPKRGSFSRPRNPRDRVAERGGRGHLIRLFQANPASHCARPLRFDKWEAEFARHRSLHRLAMADLLLQSPFNLGRREASRNAIGRLTPLPFLPRKTDLGGLVKQGVQSRYSAPTTRPRAKCP